MLALQVEANLSIALVLTFNRIYSFFLPLTVLIFIFNYFLVNLHVQTLDWKKLPVHDIRNMKLFQNWRKRINIGERKKLRKMEPKKCIDLFSVSYFGHYVVFLCVLTLLVVFFFYTNRDVVLREYKCWGNETVAFLLTITLPPRVALFSGLSDYFCTTPSTHPLFVSIYAL